MLIFRNADSIVDGYFVEPHQCTMLFSDMIDWLQNRKASGTGNVRYVQSQNGNLPKEFESLQPDIKELEWAEEYFGKNV